MIHPIVENELKKLFTTECTREGTAVVKDVTTGKWLKLVENMTYHEQRETEDHEEIERVLIDYGIGEEELANAESVYIEQYGIRIYFFDA